MLRDDCAGWFHFGSRQDERPETSQFWRIGAEKAGVADRLREIFGGKVRDVDSDGFVGVELVTGVSRFQIQVDGSESIVMEMILWGRGGVEHHCDGESFLSPVEMLGSSCGCPSRMEDRKVNARNGVGPQPSTSIYFHLGECPELGMFSFHSNSWDMAESAREASSSLMKESNGKPFELSLESVNFPTRSGLVVTYVKPAVRPFR
ncbi:recombination directionality factor [Streptomyces sp. NBC_01478]|uniref:recombination directionality factor n=1 Tax=Streptomyces sp. NBC_01478 TaxID=2903882 RepID=UPI003FCC9E29